MSSLATSLMTAARAVRDHACAPCSGFQTGTAERFRTMLAAYGRASDFLSGRRDFWPESAVVLAFHAARPGSLRRIDTGAVGNTVTRLGGSRLRDGDRIAPCVGPSEICVPREDLGPARPFAVVHAALAKTAPRAGAGLAACENGDMVAAPISLVIKRGG